MNALYLFVLSCLNVLVGVAAGRASMRPRKAFYGSRKPEPTFYLTERGEEALADAYASEHGMRDSPESRPMCGCGNCDGDLGPHVLAMHAELMRILDAKDGKDA